MLDILDTAGQEEFSVCSVVLRKKKAIVGANFWSQAIRDSSIREGNGFLIVYSIISRDSLIEVPGFVERVLQVKDRDTYPMVLLGNKCDLKDRVISQQEGEREASRFNIPYIECSAKSRINIDEAFEKISEAIVEAHRKGFYEAQTGSSFVPEVNKPRKGCTLL